MTVVNLQTGEIVEGEVVEPGLTATEARDLTDEIRQTLRAGHELIIRAFKGRAWIALGYKTWDDYCAGEFNEARMVRLMPEQRREIVADLRRAGMGTKAIGSALGVSHETARTDIQELGRQGVDLPDRIQSLDGIERPAERNWSPSEQDVARKAREAGSPERTPSRRPLPDSARDAGWDLRKAVERIQRLTEDDRFATHKAQVAPHLRSHLTNAIEVCQDLLERINNN